MINYSPEVLERGKVLRNRFAMIKLMNHCNLKAMREYPFFKYVDNHYIVYGVEWHDVKKKVEELLDYYDKGNKLNDEVLIKFYNISVINIDNPILVERIIKLIKIL